jgi:transcriptional regulator with XRE-family HTH domain
MRLFGPKAGQVVRTRFRAWRLREDLTQGQAAKLLGYAKSHIEKFDEGMLAVPKATRLAMAAISHKLEPESE